MTTDFSVIVPVYNTAAWVEKCLRSILDQVDVTIELIVIDDGSTDNSLQVCESIAADESRLHITTKVNEGQGVARNLGLTMATGRYVIFVDSDDWIEPDLCVQMRALLEQSAADFANFGLGFYNEQGRLIRTRGIADRTELCGRAIFECALLDRYIMTSPCNKVYRRSFLVKNDLRFPRVRAFEDAYFSRLVALAAQHVVFSKRSLYNVRVRQGSTSRSLTHWHFAEAQQLIALERDAFKEQLADVDIALLFKAHIVKMLTHLLIILVFRSADISDINRCYVIASESGYFLYARDRRVLAQLTVRERLYAFVASRRMLAQFAGRCGRLLGVSPQ